MIIDVMLGIVWSHAFDKFLNVSRSCGEWDDMIVRAPSALWSLGIICNMYDVDYPVHISRPIGVGGNSMIVSSSLTLARVGLENGSLVSWDVPFCLSRAIIIIVTCLGSFLMISICWPSWHTGKFNVSLANLPSSGNAEPESGWEIPCMTSAQVW